MPPLTKLLPILLFAVSCMTAQGHAAEASYPLAPILQLEAGMPLHEAMRQIHDARADHKSLEFGYPDVGVVRLRLDAKRWDLSTAEQPVLFLYATQGEQPLLIGWYLRIPTAPQNHNQLTLEVAKRVDGQIGSPRLGKLATEDDGLVWLLGDAQPEQWQRSQEKVACISARADLVDGFLRLGALPHCGPFVRISTREGTSIHVAFFDSTLLAPKGGSN